MMRTVRLIFLFSLIGWLPSVAQSTNSEDVIKALLNSKRFVFVARSVTPSGGGSLQQLTSTYTVTILPDSIISDLPYLGRMYQAPMNSQDNGIKFTSTQFDYSAKDRKKGGQDIKVKTRDVSISPLLFLTVYKNGSAALRITCSDRQSISYDGIVEELKKK